MKVVARNQTRGRLLDVGAATGILVKEALRLGYDAQGVEPSRYLQKCAEAREIPVLLGVLPHESLGGPFDIATLIDVIEHVSDPVGLLREIRQLLVPNGVCIIVTPDVSSVAAKLLGRRWCHYRIAHIGYFCRATLELAAGNAGLRVIDTHRVVGHLPVGYVLARMERYLGLIRWIKFPTTLQKWVIPLNLRDSTLAVCVPK